MKIFRIAIKSVAIGSAAIGAAGVFAHVTLPPAGATAGSEYEAAFRVGHACEGATATTGLAIRLPDGFSLTDAQQRKGWTVTPSAHEVRWQADGPASALPGSERAEFVLRGKLPAAPGVLWFKVLQTCDVGSADWAQVPPSGSATTGLKQPAARLVVLAPGVAPVDVQDAWARAAVPGQSGTGAFMKLSASTDQRLVGVATPVAGVAQVHEMKMEGDHMQMRPVPGGLPLPARQVVELRPGGYHLMLMDLRQPVSAGGSLPLTLQFEDAKGARTTLELSVPVLANAPAAAAGTAPEHMH